MRLGHLHADRPATDHQEMPGALAFGEDGFVGVVWHLLEPRNGRHQRRGSGGDHEAAGADHMLPRLHLARREEAAVFADHPDPEPFETFFAVMRGDGGNGACHMILDGREIHLGLCGPDPERAAFAHRMCVLCRRKERLRGHASVIQAIAAHLVALEQHHPRAHLHGPRRKGKPARACADDAEICFDPFHYRALFILLRSFSTIGMAARRQRPRMGSKIRGSKITPRSGVSPRANTSPSPDPIAV